jgi:hypothetical protein
MKRIFAFLTFWPINMRPVNLFDYAFNCVIPPLLAFSFCYGWLALSIPREISAQAQTMTDEVRRHATEIDRLQQSFAVEAKLRADKDQINEHRVTLVETNYSSLKEEMSDIRKLCWYIIGGLGLQLLKSAFDVRGRWAYYRGGERRRPVPDDCPALPENK